MYDTKEVESVHARYDRALLLIEEAISVVDAVGAPADIGAYLDLARIRLLAERNN